MASCGETQPRGGVAVDDHVGLQAFILLVAVGVADRGERAHLVEQLGGPDVQLVERVAAQGVLVLRIAATAADPDILHRLQVEGGAGDAREAAAQAGDHHIGGDAFALIDVLQLHEHAAGITEPPPVNPTTLSTAGSCCTMSTNAASFSLMAGKEMSCAPTMEPVSRPVSCCGKKPLGTTM